MTSSRWNALTKIVATVGPATASPAMLRELIAAGVSVIRLNFSHGSHDVHRDVYANVRSIATDLQRPVTILQDLQGPKLRIGDLEPEREHVLESGHTFRISTRPFAGNARHASTSYRHLADDVAVGDRILIDDGTIEIEVTAVERGTEHGDDVVTRVVHGGTLKPQKGINLPGTVVSAPALTEKDIEDLAFGISLGVDVIALSFVRSAADLIQAREAIDRLGGTQPLIAKIEKPQAVRNLDAIVAAADGVMVARGDLGVELSPEGVPLVQKRLIRLANQAGKPVITATQMLESMIENPRPTRAEASDIANAILDGTDAVMLSGETAVGRWPIRAVEMMVKIACTIEADESWGTAMRAVGERSPAVGASAEAIAVSRAAQSIVNDLRPKAIAVLTATGGTAQRISQQRPGVPIVAFTDGEDVAARLALWHGVVPVFETLATNTDALITQVVAGVRRLGIAGPGDRIVIVGAVPRANDVRSVFLELHRI